jgi:hypothetical protein
MPQFISQTEYTGNCYLDLVHISLKVFCSIATTPYESALYTKWQQVCQAHLRVVWVCACMYVCVFVCVKVYVQVTLISNLYNLKHKTTKMNHFIPVQG